MALGSAKGQLRGADSGWETWVLLQSAAPCPKFCLLWVVTPRTLHLDSNHKCLSGTCFGILEQKGRMRGWEMAREWMGKSQVIASGDTFGSGVKYMCGGQQ